MPVDQYSAASGQSAWAGRWPGKFSGDALMAAMIAAGTVGGGTPSGLSGDVAMDAMAPAGTVQGYSVPAWLAGKPLNEWFQISGTSGAGGCDGFAYSGAALRHSNSEIVIAAAGGHGQGRDNRVVSIALSDDVPGWVQRRAATVTSENDVLYYFDGRRASSHLYSMSHYIAQRSRVMNFGLFGGYPNAASSGQVDGFNLDPLVNDWDAAGTWASLGSGQAGNGTCLDVATGDVRCVIGTSIYKWTQATATQALQHDFGSGQMSRLCVWDSSRQQVVAIGIDIGRDPYQTNVLNFHKIDSTGTSRTALTLTGSAATQFLTDAPYAFGIEYVDVLDKILIYTGGLCGTGGGGGAANASAKDIYVLTPDSSSTWSIDLLTHGAGSITPAASVGAGVFNRFRYVTALGGCAYVCFNASSVSPNVYFMRLV